MKKMVLIGLILMIMVLASGCASYSPRKDIPDVKTFQETGIKAVNAEAGITIVAYPIQTREDAKLYFDSASLVNDRLLPVYVSVLLAKEYKIDFVILSIDGKSYSPLSVDDTYKLIKKSWFVRSSFWWFFGAYIGAPISAIHTNIVNNKIKEDLEKRGIKEGEIKKNASGFLYFKISDSIESLDNSFLVFILANKDSANKDSRNLTVKIPLRGMITAK